MRHGTPPRRTHSVVLLAVFLATAASPLYAQIAQGPARLPSGTIVVRGGESGGLERSEDGGVHFTPVDGLPVRVLPASLAGETLPVSAFALETADRTNAPGIVARGYATLRSGNRALAAAGNRLFTSTDGVQTWAEIDLSGITNPSSYITALAIDPADASRWYLGTSYDGLYETTDAGSTWVDLTESSALWPTYLGAGFFEEIASILFTPAGSLVIELAYGQGYVAISMDPIRVTRLGPADSGPSSYRVLADAIDPRPLRGVTWPDTSAGATPPGIASRETANTGAAKQKTAPPGAAGSMDTAASSSTVPNDAAARRRALADGHRGIYLSAVNAMTEKLPGYFDYMARHGLDSVVVDFKDDTGKITYASSLPLARATGAVTPIIDPKALVAAAHARGIYVIARVVVFKDPKLYAYDGYRYAIWDRRRNAPWGVFRTYTDEETGESHTVQVEAWVDPYSPDVWQYDIDVANEAASFGVDEIQFDYIRFPSDGRTDDIQTRYAVAGADRVQALEGFLQAARTAIDLPIGIDVYGFNAWSRMNYLGQDITRLAAFVDVISPMFYPSHFARPFLPHFTYLDRASVIYDEGTRRAVAIANTNGSNTLIRPYVQAFLIGSELDFDEPTYLRYLQLQLSAAARAHSNGYTMWNASGRYYMLP